MTTRFLSIAAALLLTACIPALLPTPSDGKVDGAATDAVIAPANAVTADQFDTTTEAERQAALASVPAGERELGRTVTSLGDPADPGFWLKTPLVCERGPGRVVYTATGQSVAVELIPIDGPASGGSRVSLPAMRLLGAPLTGLPELVVYAD